MGSSHLCCLIGFKDNVTDNAVEMREPPPPNNEGEEKAEDISHHRPDKFPFLAKDERTGIEKTQITCERKSCLLLVADLQLQLVLIYLWLCSESSCPKKFFQPFLKTVFLNGYKKSG